MSELARKSFRTEEKLNGMSHKSKASMNSIGSDFSDISDSDSDRGAPGVPPRMKTTSGRNSLDGPRPASGSWDAANKDQQGRFGNLKRNRQLKKILRSYLRTHTLSQKSRTLSHNFNKFREKCKRRKLVRLHLLSIQQRYIHHSKKSAFEIILSLWHSRRLIRKTLNRILNKRSLFGFNRWKEYCDTRIYNKLFMRKLVSRYNRCSTRGAYMAWLEYLDYVYMKKADQLIYQKAVRFCTNHSLLRAKKGWADYVEEKLWLKHTFGTLGTRLSRISVVRALNTWREFLELIRVQKSVMRMFARKLLFRSVVAAIGRWREWMEEQEHNKGIVQRLLHLPLMRAMNTWKVCINKQKFREEIKDRVLKRWLQRAASSGWEAWVSFVRRRRLTKFTLNRVVRAWKNRELRDAWWAWRELMSVHEEKKHRLFQTLRRFGNLRLYSAYSTWAENVLGYTPSERSRSIEIRNRVTMRLKNIQVYAGFNKWLQYLEDIYEARVKINKVMGRWNNQELARAWQDWIRAVSGTKLLHENESLVQRVARRFLLRQVAASFNSWVEYTDRCWHQKRIIYNFYMKFKNKNVSSAFQKWKECYLVAVRKKNLLKQAGCRWMFPEYFKGFYTWAQKVKILKENRRVCRVMLERWSRREEWSALYTWNYWLCSRRNHQPPAEELLIQLQFAHDEALAELGEVKDNIYNHVADFYAAKLSTERQRRALKCMQEDARQDPRDKLLQHMLNKFSRRLAHQKMLHGWNRWRDMHRNREIRKVYKARTRYSDNKILMMKRTHDENTTKLENQVIILQKRLDEVVEEKDARIMELEERMQGDPEEMALRIMTLEGEVGLQEVELNRRTQAFVMSNIIKVKRAGLKTCWMEWKAKCEHKRQLRRFTLRLLSVTGRKPTLQQAYLRWKENALELDFSPQVQQHRDVINRWKKEAKTWKTRTHELRNQLGEAINNIDLLARAIYVEPK